MTPPPPIPIDELLAQAGWVQRLARRLAHDAQSADDLTQGALTAALESPPARDRPLRPWLARVVTNLARKERRGAARRGDRERQHAPLARSVPATDQLMAELDEQRRIARLAGELREPYRTVLLLHYYRDQPAAVIAREQGVSAATVRSQLARGLALLRERVEAQHDGDSRSALGALWLAAGASEALPRAAGLSSTTSTALLTQTLLLMNSSTKVLVASAACALVVTGVLGLRALDHGDPVSPGATPAPQDPGTAPVSSTQSASSERTPVDGTRETVPGAVEAGVPAEDDVPPAVEEPGPTRFVARAVDGEGLPIDGAAFAVVTEEGRPRPFGIATTSGLDGRVAIEVEKKAFFTYAGRAESNTYMSLCAPGHARHFFVPAAKRGTEKDLGDIVLGPGGTVTGRVIDVSGAPIEGAVVVGTATLTRGDEAARVMGPEREGGRPTALTGPLGRFTLEGVHVGQVVLWASDAGTLWTASDVLEVAAGDVLPGVELVLDELPKSAMVAGLVVDPRGAPVPNALIRHGTPGGWGETKFNADAAGAFLIPAPTGTPFRIMATDPSGELGSSAEQYVKAGDVEVRLELPERRTLRIRVARASDGEPIEGASVITMPLEEQQFFMNSDWEHSDAEGLLDLPVPGEPFRVNVGHTSFEYRKFGPFDPAALPDEVFAELKQKPRINGVVLAGRDPVPGAHVDIVESCEERFRPLFNGFPLRVFDGGGLEESTTDEEGRFSLPTNEHASAAPVLLVTKDGYALTELLLDLPEPSAGAEDVEVQMNAGGTLEGRVLVGPKRNPKSVVVVISRGDGRPKITRPDAGGRYRFEHLTPGSWRVEDRDAEPEGRVFGMAQGDEHPFRWDCEVRVGETTVYDLDLRWQDDLRVEGRLTFDGKGAVGWTAVLEAPDHSDRPWPARPVTLDEGGSYSLEARPGYAKLVLHAPPGGPLKMLLKREMLIDQHLEPAVFELETGGLAGTLAEGALKLRLHHRIDATTHIEATFESGADGRTAIEGFPAGEASFQHHRNAVAGKYGAGWYPRAQIELRVGEILQVE